MVNKSGRERKSGKMMGGEDEFLEEPRGWCLRMFTYKVLTERR